MAWEQALTGDIDIVRFWFAITGNVANILFPIGNTSILYPSVVVDDFISLGVTFYGNAQNAKSYCIDPDIF